MFHEDLPSNDFSPLMNVLAQQAPSTYTHASRRVTAYPAYFATSYYNRLLPHTSVQLAIASSALHWLSTKPVPIPDTIIATRTRDPVGLRARAQQAHTNLHTFLCLRAREFVPGGSLVFVMPYLPDPPGTSPSRSTVWTRWCRSWWGRAACLMMTWPALAASRICAVCRR